MTNEQIQISLIMVVTIGLFIYDKVRYDIVAILALLACVVLGIVPAEKSFSGFSHPATITVIFIFILSQFLVKSGSLDKLADILLQQSSKSDYKHLFCLLLVAAILSMFMNNVGALALIMPIAIAISSKLKKSNSLVLMPLSFVTLLGGTCTMIGTPPNIIISTYREKTVGVGFAMFDFSYVGLLILLAGTVFLTFFSKFFLHKRESDTTDTFAIESYLFEVKVIAESLFINKNVKEITSTLDEFDMVVLSLIRQEKVYCTLLDSYFLEEGDILLLEGNIKDLDKLVTSIKLKIMGQETPVTISNILNSPQLETAEVVISSMSDLDGRKIEQIQFHKYYGLNLLAISRHGFSYRGRIRAFTIQAGDILLLHGDKELLNRCISKLKLLPIDKQKIHFGQRNYATLGLLAFFLAITAAAMRILPMHISIGLATTLLVICNVIPKKDIYHSVKWPIIVLIGAMIPIGEAVETTKLAELLVNNCLTAFPNASTISLLTMLIIISMLASDFLHNATTVILMAPIANLTAIQSGSNPDPFLLAVALGASCSFLTPIGHQNNSIILGPGKYKFLDFWRLGLPLQLIVILVAVPALHYFWPAH